jgi:ribosome-binding protein aMBF1 (putative translation factor)
MTLDSYFKTEGRGAVSRLARKMQIHPSLLSRIRSGEYAPNVKQAKAIEQFTGGKVSAAALLGLEPKRKERVK